jgi:cytochrome b6-f complex iron-sulfur subunit
VSAATVLAIVIPVLVILAVVLFITSSRRGDARRGAGALARDTVKRDRSDLVSVGAERAPVTGREVERAAEQERSTALVPAAPAAPPALYTPPDAEALAVTRRQFFNRSAITLMLLSLGAFGGACIAFLWPQLGAGFGTKINVGNIDDLVAQIRANKNFLYLPEGRAWLTEYPKEGLPKAEKVYAAPVFNGQKAGINALYQKCPHLGCRVPNCDSSQWFECPCHGSQYNRVGEKKGGPAPRGMDRFGVNVAGGNVVIDTSQVFQGPPIGTNTTGQEAEGPHCIGGKE